MERVAVNVKTGESTRVVFKRGDLAYDLGDSVVSHSIDGGMWENTNIIDASDGVVELPPLDEGIHSVEYLIEHPDGSKETLPSTGVAKFRMFP